MLQYISEISQYITLYRHYVVTYPREGFPEVQRSSRSDVTDPVRHLVSVNPTSLPCLDVGAPDLLVMPAQVVEGGGREVLVI